MEEGLALAQEVLGQAQCRYKRYYNKKARVRIFKVGDKVLILLPADSNKVIMQWKGPLKVEEVVAVDDYRINVRGKVKTYVNLRKKYFDRARKGKVGTTVIHFASAAMAECSKSVRVDVVKDEALLELGYIGGKESYKDVNIDADLDDEKKRNL